MELNLHPIATKCFVSGRDFQENDRVVSYLVRETNGEIARRDLHESEDGRFMPPAFIYCRWILGFKHRKAGENADRTLKLNAETLFLSLATPAGGSSEGGADPVNTPLLQFLALMMERKRQLKPRGVSKDGAFQIYEHKATHQLYEVPVGELNVEFFQKIQEHLGVLVGTPKSKVAAAEHIAPAEPAADPVPAVEGNAVAESEPVGDAEPVEESETKAEAKPTPADPAAT